MSLPSFACVHYGATEKGTREHLRRALLPSCRSCFFSLRGGGGSPLLARFSSALCSTAPRTRGKELCIKRERERERGKRKDEEAAQAARALRLYVYSVLTSKGLGRQKRGEKAERDEKVDGSRNREACACGFSMILIFNYVREREVKRCIIQSW